ncbi:MAG: putative toxin-antitoxin system toxin component, PIN family, partial [Burkholderiaceae bacterium]
MRVILDTNILISALITQNTYPDRLYEAWRDGQFELLCCEQQIDELRAVTRRPGISQLIKSSEAGHLVNSIRSLATMITRLPQVDIASDPNDDFLLALAQAGQANYLVTGDMRALLSLKQFGETRIMSARDFAQDVI